MRLEDRVAQYTDLKREGTQLKGCCPFHEETRPSFYVDPQKQVYFCHGCEATGNLFWWLVNKEGMDKKEAAKLAELPERPPPSSAKPPKVWTRDEIAKLAGHSAEHLYINPDKTPAFLIVRFDKEKYLASGADEKYFAKVRPYTPVEGGFICKLEMVRDRPLYKLPLLANLPKEKQVMVVEGEKCVDAVRRWKPEICTVTCAGGSKAWRKTDWRPLAGHPVMLVADADKAGRKMMTDLAAHLHKICKAVKLVLPPGESGDDIADWLELGGWPKAHEEIAKALSAYKAPDPIETPKSALSLLEDNKHFRILGNLADSVAIMLSTHRVLQVSRAAMVSPQTFISLADHGWWCEILQSPTGTLGMGVCQPAGSAMIRIADKRGQIDPTKMVGRGFVRTEKGRYVWHLGDRLLVDEHIKALRDMPDGMVALSGPPLELHDHPASPDDRYRVAESVLRYRWEAPRDGRMFLGWLVASLVGGALDWRPHLWMVAPAESGKTWLLKNVAASLLGDSCVQLADATPAAIARRMGSDSLPMLLDEAEPDRQWIEGIMDIIRIAAGGDGERIRSDPGVSITSSQPRFSAMLSSVKLAQLTAANATRFVQPRLSMTPVSNWPEVRKMILDSMADRMGARIRAAAMIQGPDIVELSRKLTDELVARGIGDRAAQIYGAISAGWMWFSGGDEMVDPPKVEKQDSSTEGTDLLKDILGLRLRDSANHDVSIASLLAARGDSPLAVDYGCMRTFDDGLMIAAGHSSLKEKLERTKWKGVDAMRTLMQVPGAVKTPHPRRFGQVRMRCVIFSDDALKAAGIVFMDVQMEAPF